jgi:hypothetical protein
VVDPASHPIPRVGWYSRDCPTQRLPGPPTGLSPPPVGRSSAVRLHTDVSANAGDRTPDTPYYPGPAARPRSYADPVWAPPVSLAATPGILSLPRGTEMFQFPRSPHGHTAVSPRCRGGVAPFGYPWITRCQHVPRAFRGVAASFIGSRRLGIHRALIIVDSHPADPPDTPLSRRRRDPAPCFGLHASCPAETGVLSGGVAGIRTPDLRRARAALSQLSYDPVAASAQPRPSVGAPGLEPGTSVLSGPRSHHLSYAPAARPRGRRRRSEATTHLRSIPHPPAPPGRPQTGP